MNRFLSPRIAFLGSSGFALMILLAGCSSSSTTSARFTASATVPAPGLVKLVQKTSSGSRVVVDVLIFGPEPTLDLLASRFGIKIADPALVRLVPQSTYAQTALVGDAGQTIAMDVDSSSDPSLVQIEVVKNGGGVGNGFAAASAVLIELTFAVHGSGTTTLTLTGLGNDLPQAIDSTRRPIATVTFDGASASVKGVTTGGGY